MITTICEPLMSEKTAVSDTVEYSYPVHDQTALHSSGPAADELHEWALAAFYQAALIHRLPVAVWQHPGSSERHAIVDLSGHAQPARIDFHRAQPSFVFSPFVAGHGGPQGGQPHLSAARHQETLLIRADLHLSPTGLYTYQDDTAQRVGWDDTWAGKMGQRFRATYRQLLMRPDAPMPRWYTPHPTQHPNQVFSRDQFCHLVRTAIDFIHTSELNKIVVSRLTETELPPNFSPIANFLRLSNRYSHAFVSLVAIPEVGTWIGASPELLLQVQHERLTTVALAGTQARSADLPLEAIPWGEKEVVEQALVSDYIRAFFGRVGVQRLHEDGPRTVSAGNVVHLQTKFQVETSQAQTLTLANQVLNELHPTSAVCGMPKDKALSFILTHEGYDRSFYSGFLGPVHLAGESSLYVNLRCMQLTSTRAQLYVGCGITADSIPDAEWRETVLKSKTLLSVIA